MDLPEMSSNVLFTERTVDGDDAMDIDGEEMAETKVDAVEEEEGYLLKAMEFLSLHSA